MQFYDNFLEQHVKGSVITHLNIAFGCVQYTCLLIQNNTPEAFSSGHTKIVDLAHFYWFGWFLLISRCTWLNLLISTAHGRGRPRVHPEIKIFAMGAPVGGSKLLISNWFLLIWCKNVDMKSTFLAAHGRPRPWAAEINRFSCVHPEINKNCPNQ